MPSAPWQTTWRAAAGPGYVVLGLDKNGRTVGLRYAGAARDQAQLDWANRLGSTKLLPHPSAVLHPVDVTDEVFVLVIEVQPYAVPPVVEVNRVAWVRVGTQTRRASEADLARLRERRPERTQPFDLRAVPGAALDDLDLDLLRRLHAAAAEVDEDPQTFPALERWLVQRDWARYSGEVCRPNAAALLLFGPSPQSFLPGATVEFARYAGTDWDAPVSLRKTLTGPVGGQLDALWRLFDGLIASVPAGEQGVRTPYAPQYPLEAVKELIRNMLQHRSYEATNAPARIAWFDGRIVFNNPGGPFGQAGLGRLGDHSDYRNPTLTRGLAELGYVERLGRGIKRVERILAAAGHPPLEFETDGFTTVTLRGRA